MEYINDKIESKNYKYIIILLICFGLLFYFNKKPIRSLKYNNYDKIYFINLEKRKDRYKRFNIKFQNSDFNMNKAKIIREWIKKWKKKSSTIDSEQHLWNTKNLKRFEHKSIYQSNPEKYLWNIENSKKIEKLLDKHLKNIN